MDKFAADMALDFKESNVAVMSIWMGALLTDRLKMIIAGDRAKYGYLEKVTETPEFTGHILWALYNDPKLMDLSGQTVIGAEMALKYGITDKGGKQPQSYRDTHHVEPRAQYPMSSDRAEPRLTSLSHGGGCGSKIAPGVLAELLKDMPAGVAIRIS